MSKSPTPILIIDDDPDVVTAARLLLKQAYSDVHTENDPYRLNTILKQQRFDVVLLDMNFKAGASSGEEGLRWMNKILRQSPGTSVILMTAYGDVQLAVQAIKGGAADFVTKPWDNARLLETVAIAAKAAQEERQEQGLHPTSEHSGSPASALGDQGPTIIGGSAAMERVFTTLRKVGKTDANVLILGENGTGKELIARALHQASPRVNRVFVPVDLGAIPESLFEAELFGHKKGAFTDAREDRPGRFEHAHQGTLFLDEIGNLSLPLQAKLLTVLQNRQVVRVGTNTPINVDIRLVCATNMPLHEMVRDGRFRQDLLYRINTVEVPLPPLRERGEDILQLAHHYLAVYSAKYQTATRHISPATRHKLFQYHWPGNIRELQHAVERAVIMSEGDTLQPEDFILSEPQPAFDPLDSTPNLNLEEVEKVAIRNAVLKHQGNLSKAAKELGLGRTTLYRKMSRYGI
jgi:two-component system response regulator HydG